MNEMVFFGAFLLFKMIPLTPHGSLSARQCWNIRNVCYAALWQVEKQAGIALTENGCVNTAMIE